MAEFAATGAAGEEGGSGATAAASSGGGDGPENYPLTVLYCGGESEFFPACRACGIGETLRA